MNNAVIILLLISLILAVIVLEQKTVSNEQRGECRKRWPAHFSLFMMAVAVQLALPIGAATAAAFAKSSGFGILNWLNISFWPAAILGYLCLSLAAYLMHLAFHKVPMLWRLHQVHHSDYHLDVTTMYRAHPLAVVTVAVVIAAVVTIVGAGPETVLFYSLTVLVIDLFHHSSLTWPRPLEALLEKIIITPSQHHIHHSNFQPETDTNYSVDLCIWDRVFGTYLKAPIRDGEAFEYGLKQVSQGDAIDLHTILKSPFKSK